MRVHYKDYQGALSDINEALDRENNPTFVGLKQQIQQALKPKAKPAQNPQPPATPIVPDSVPDSEPVEAQTPKRVRSGGGVNYSPAQRKAWLKGSPLPRPVALESSKYNIGRIIQSEAERRCQAFRGCKLYAREATKIALSKRVASLLKKAVAKNLFTYHEKSPVNFNS